MDGNVSRVPSFSRIGELMIRRCRLALRGIGNGKSILSLIGEVDWIRWVGGGVDGDV
jgi:hypothetical protein